MMLRRSWLAWAMVAIGSLAFAGAAAAAPDAPVTQSLARKRVVQPLRATRDDRVNSSSSNRLIDVNNINMFVTNLGSWANDFANNNNSGLFFPKGTNKTAVYESGIWIGAKSGTTPLATIAEYSQEFGPGAMIGGTFDDPSKPAYQVYKMARYTGDPQDTAHVERSATALAADRTLDAVVHHSWSEYLNGAAPYGAPVKTYRLPDPAHPGDSLDVLGPDVSGDQMLWAVYNDADASLHQNKAGRSAPLGLEIQQSTFGFDRQGALGNTVFLRFKMYNKGGQQLDSMYVSLWADPDLGGAGDDLVGCDIPASLGFVYNATNTDQLYGSRPPAVGYDFFQGPKVGANTLGLASFDFYINGKDPQNAAQTFNLMKGLNADGTPVIDPTTDLPSAFYAPGDPVKGTGWLDSNPADRRFLMSAGPFSMAPGDSQVVVGAIVIAQGGNRLASVNGMKFFDVKAQKAFDLNFNLPSPPPQPKVAFSTGHESVNLSWDSGSRFNYAAPAGYVFEGYNVYQGASISGPWTRLATFDIADGITDVRDTVFDATTGLIINDTPVAFGGDVGVQYTYTTTQDQVRGGTLKDGTKYFYAVTAYAVNPTPARGLEKVLETSFRPVSVIVQRPASGTDVAAAYVNPSKDHQVDTEQTPTTDHVVVDVTDPASITGHTYAITYSGGPAPRPRNGATRAAAAPTWNLVDLTTGTTLLRDQTERTDSPSYAPVDGMLVKLRESKSSRGPLNDIYYAPFDSDMPFAGTGAGLGSGATGTDLFDDSFGYAFDFFAGIDPEAQPELFTNVELRFGPTQKAYRYFRDENPSSSRGYQYGGFQTAPFQAWDVDHNQQLEVGFVERRITDDSHNPVGAQPASQNGLWDPTTNTSDGGREYLAISSRHYTGTEAPELAQDGAFVGADTLWEYAAWLYKKGSVKPGDRFIIEVGGNVTGTSNDSLVFTTSAPAQNNVALQKAGFGKIRAVPNPYYAHSNYELASLNRIMKFVNMPEVATVKIFNLAGDLVRTLRKTDTSSSILEWDLLTENRLPVASGVYVYHIDVPGAGSTTGKLVVFMEKERLSNF